jgi:hypothetical protein
MVLKNLRYRRAYLAAGAIVLCAALGITTAVGVAWWLALAAVLTFTFTDRPSVNIAPEGSPWYTSSLDFADEHRRGLTRVELRAGNGGPASFGALIAGRVAAALEAKVGQVDWQARYAGNKWLLSTARDPRWPSWVRLPPDDESQYVTWSGRAAGWPELCFCSRSWTSAESPTRVVSGSAVVFGPSHYGARAPWSADPDRGSIPLIPIWRGLAVDAGFFGAAWALVVVLPIAAFRWARDARRRRRGWCAACGYDMQGVSGAPCPECGLTRT